MSDISWGIQPPYGRYNIYHTMCLIPQTRVHSVNMIVAPFHWFKEWHSGRNCFKLLPTRNSWKSVKYYQKFPQGECFFEGDINTEIKNYLSLLKYFIWFHNGEIFTWRFYCQINVSLLHLLSSVAFLFSCLCHWKSLPDSGWVWRFFESV